MATIITANIGSTKIKVCEIQPTPKGLIIHKAFTIKTPEGIVDDGRIVNKDKLATAISSEFIKQGVMSTEIIFTLRSSKIAAKEVYTPVLKGNKLKDMIRANITEYFPIDVENYIITEKVVSQVTTEEGGKQLRVNVMAAPRDMVEGYHELAKRLDMTVRCIDYHSNAAVSLLKNQIGPETCAVIQVHDDSTTVNIFKNNILELQRTVSYGKNLAVKAVMESHNLGEAEAEGLLSKERLIHSSFDGDEVTESLQYLINSIVRVVDYYSSRNSENPVTKAYLTGDSVNMVGVETLFSNAFEFNVMQISSYEGVSVGPDLVMDPKYISSYVTTVGALLDPVDFKLDTVETKETKDKTMQYMFIGVVGSVVAGLAMVVIPFVQSLMWSADIEDVEEKIAAVREIEMVVDDYFDSVDKLRDVDTFVNMTKNANDYLLDFIYALEKAQPSDVSIKSMSVNSGKVSITAVTSTKQTIAKFITQLKGIPGVGSVFVSNTSESKNEYGVVTSSFSITCTFNSNIESYVAPDEQTEENATEEVQ